MLYCSEPCKYQLRAYIYQARDLLAADDTGHSGVVEVVVVVALLMSISFVLSNRQIPLF